MVHLNGSLGSPAGQIADPQRICTAHWPPPVSHVLGVAYRNLIAVIGVLCNGSPTCFAPTRRVVLEVMLQGTRIAFEHACRWEIVQRIDAESPSFPLPDRAVVGPNIAQAQTIPMSQSARRVEQSDRVRTFPRWRAMRPFGICCDTAPRRSVVIDDDYTSGVPAPWTSSALTWPTVPKTAFVGFAAPTTFTAGNPTAGDTTCPYHAAVWQNLGWMQRTPKMMRRHAESVATPTAQRFPVPTTLPAGRRCISSQNAAPRGLGLGVSGKPRPYVVGPVRSTKRGNVAATFDRP